MCGRTRLLIPFRELADLYRCASSPSFEWPDAPQNDIRPTNQLAVVRLNSTGTRTLDRLRWGLVPPWADDIKFGSKTFNARVETAGNLPAFRDAWKKRRCLVLSDAFYEWSGPKTARTPNLIQLQDGSPMAMAGLWETWKDKETGEIVESCTILTKAAEGPIKALHDRMPIVLPPDVHDDWLAASTGDPNVVLASALCDEFVITAMDRIANKRDTPANDSPASKQLKLFG